MVGDGHIPIAAAAARLNELLKRTRPVAPCRMHMQIALNVFKADKRISIRIALDFRAVFTQLRGNVRQPEMGVKRRFIRERFHLASRFVFHAVFADFLPALFGELAHAHVMLLRSGEMMERGRKLRPANQPEVDGHIVVIAKQKRHFRFPSSDDLADTLKTKKPVAHRSRTVGGDDIIQIFHRFVYATQTAGPREADHAIKTSKLAFHIRRGGEHPSERQPLRAFARLLNRRQQLFLRFRAKTRKLPHFSHQTRFFQSIHIDNTELLMQLGDFFAAKPRDLKQGKKRFRNIAL
ncbi:hypothetical protein B4109_2284 [Geobacillus stearothermophilus]|uniref:Uncharacterized protein n=1 Tax=Geobacillus stearothermophilus TaxID=1422 RepID=A0A150MFU3_GEOSE|nr:hypothetical protein B4109_2284 [Geobacillus stearothermophilus]